MLDRILLRQADRNQVASPDLAPHDRPGSVELAIVVYCAWQSRDLVIAWQQSSVDRLGWLALLIWCLPALLLPFVLSGPRSSSRWRVALLGLALFCGVLGQLGDVNTVQHVGLALALGAVAWYGKRTLPWLLGAVSWMPLLGWLVKGIAPVDLVPIRLLLAAVSGGWMFLAARHGEGGGK